MSSNQAGGTPGESAWRRFMRKSRQGQLQPRSELLDLLHSLDGRNVEVRSKADRFGRIDVWTGRLQAAHPQRGQVRITLVSGEEQDVLISWITYVVDDGGREHGPFKTPAGLF